MANKVAFYEHVAASQTDQVGGVTGGIGDVLEKLIIIPETTAAGTCQIQDGSGTAVDVFVSGTLADLTPIVLDFGPNMVSRAGAWSITTGANVHAIAIGKFSLS